MLGRSRPDETITLKDVPAEKFITAYAAHLKKTQKITPIEGHEYLKTAYYKDMNPVCLDWYYTRAAALARKLYLRPRIGVGRLRHLFGSVRRNGHCSSRHAKAGGKIIRHALQQLEQAGILGRYKDSHGNDFNERVVTREGQKELNEVAKNVFNSLFVVPDKEEEVEVKLEAEVEVEAEN